MAFAAAYPERVSSLDPRRLLRPVPRGPDYPIGAPRRPSSRQALDQADARRGRGVMLDLFAPSVANDERLRRTWARYERSAQSPGSTKAIVRLIYESDVRDVLPDIRVPTLVIHRADATGFRVEHGRYLAAHIPDATYVELPGIDNLIWAGDQDAIVGEIQDVPDRQSDRRPSPAASSRPSCSRTSLARRSAPPSWATSAGSGCSPITTGSCAGSSSGSGAGRSR